MALDDTPALEPDGSPAGALDDTAELVPDDSPEAAQAYIPELALDDSPEAAPDDIAELAQDGYPELAAAGSGTPEPESAAQPESLGPAASAPDGYPELAAAARGDSSDPVPAAPAGPAHLAGSPRDGCRCNRADSVPLDRLRARGARHPAERGDTPAAADFPLHSTVRDRRPAGMASVEAALQCCLRWSPECFCFEPAEWSRASPDSV